MKPGELTTQEQFFYDNAGFSYDPKTETEDQGRHRCAIAMAKAENEARDKLYHFVWDDDSDGCIGCECGSSECQCFVTKGKITETHQPQYCQMLNENDDIVQSLSGICDTDAKYHRVVQAELALEELG